MAALVRAESIPEDPQEFETVPIATEYTIRVIEGSEVREAAYKLRAGKVLPYEKILAKVFISRTSLSSTKA